LVLGQVLDAVLELPLAVLLDPQLWRLAPVEVDDLTELILDDA